jgi:hypothetical protein
MYNATLYLNTGFNAINVPDSLATLNLVPNANKITVPALDIYQARELSSFVVKANYSQIRDADYLYLINSEDSTDFAFYSVQNVEMTSMDTAVVYVTMDYILTAGGATTLEFTDGICERHHVGSNETFGQYDEDDPYIAPAEMMKIEETIPEFYNYSELFDEDDIKVVLYDGVTIIESTVDLEHMWYDAHNTGSEPLAIDYTDTNSGNTVTVPNVYGAGSDWFIAGGNSASPLTKAWMQYAPNSANMYKSAMPNVTMYVADQGDTEWESTYITQDLSWLRESLGYIRGLGVESCILNQYVVPAGMIEAECTPMGAIKELKGKCLDVQLSALPFASIKYSQTYGYSVQNMRLLYGKNCQYTIASIASGNSASFLPEEICFKDNELSTSPTIQMRVDPRPNGAPYFNFDAYRGISTNFRPELFFTNAVRGLSWQNAPLIYTGASGSILNRYDYAANKYLMTENYAYDRNMNLLNAIAGVSNDTFSAGRSASGMPGSFESYNEANHWINNGTDRQRMSAMTSKAHAAGNIIGSTMSMAQAAAGIATRIAGSMTTKDHIVNKYGIEKDTELRNLLIANQVVAPSMNFPMSEGIRDYVGNTCIVYRYYYTENDLRRLDKILNMYGYKHTVPIENSFLTNRPKYNYIQVRGASIKDTGIPKWLRDGASAQLSIGTRIWHQLPDPSAYTDGTNRPNP